MSFEPDEARYVWACFDQPDLKAPHSVHGDRAGGLDGGQQQRRPAGRRARGRPPLDVRPDAAAVDVQPGRQRRAVPRDPPRGAGGYDLGLFARRSLAAVLDRDADELFTVTEQGLAFFGERSGCRSRSAKYDQVFVPEFGGAMENYGCVTWSDVFLRGTTPAPPSGSRWRRCCSTRWRTCGSATSSRCAGGTTSGSTRRSRSSRATGPRSGPPATPTPGRATSPSDKLEAYLADQGPDLAPDPPADPRRRGGRVDLRRDHLPQGRLGAAAADDLRRRGAVPARHDGVLREARLGQHHPPGPDRRARRGQRPRPRRVARGWLETAGTDRLTLDRASDGSVLVAHGPHGGPPRPQVLAVGAYRRTARRGLERVGAGPRRGARASARRWSCRRARTSTWSTTTT